MKKNLSLKMAVFAAVSVVFFSFAAGDNEWTKTELYFGLSIPGGGIVSNEEFQAFTDSVIAVTFTEGFSIINSTGGWFDPDIKQTIFEDSRIVIRYSKMDDITSAAIDTIRAKYKRYYNQQSVLRVDQKVSVGF